MNTRTVSINPRSDGEMEIKTYLLMELKFECPVCGETHTDDEYYLEVLDGEVDDNLEEWVDCDCGEEMDLMEQKTIKTITD